MNLLQELEAAVSLSEAAAFKKYGNHKGIQYRTITKAERDAATKRQAEREEEHEHKRYANSKEGKIEKLRLEKIPQLDAKEIEDIVAGGGPGGLGGDIDDITNIKHGFKNISGVKVAAVSMRISMMVNLKDMYDQKTIDEIYNGKETVEETVGITIYRDPKNPKKLRDSY